MGWWWTSTPSQSSGPSNSTPSTPSTTLPTETPTPTRTDEDDFNDAFPHLAPSQPAAESSAPKQTEYPDTMSCRQAFDSAFYCQSFGGKFNDIYRYGELKSCNDHWADFWFCMRIKSKAESVKRELIVERYKAKEDKIRTSPNSEDVWRARKPHEKLQNPFQEPLEDD